MDLTKPKKTCDHPGCRKARVGGAFCEKHQEDGDALAGAIRITELEAYRWGMMDAEIRNALLGMRISDFEIEVAKRQYVELKQSKELEKLKLQETVARLRPEYTEMVTELAKKYGIADPANMTIDPDSRIIRDLSVKEVKE